MGLSGLAAASTYQAPHAFGYVGFKPRGFGLSAGVSGSRTSTENSRRIAFAATERVGSGGAPLFDGIDREAQSVVKAVVSDQWGEYSDNVEVKTYTIDWRVGVRRMRFSRDDVTETGAGALSLFVPGQKLTFKQSDVKLHLWRHSGYWRPFVEMMFRWEMTSGRTTTGLRFAEAPGSDFEVEGLPAPGDTFTGRGGMTLMTRLGALTFEYGIRHAPGQTRQNVDVRYRFK